jgi:hypothetical protein
MTPKAVRMVLAIAVGIATVQAGFAQELRTPAERVDYQQGGTLYEPLMEFVYELESRTELMNVRKLTETLLERDLVLAILSNPPMFKPEDVRRSGKPVVLIVNNVHGGEVAGKDASMEIMRDLVMGDLRPLLEDVVVLIVPTINPDGAEVRRRTNEEGFDLNRDYLKLESQEIHALVTKVINAWDPDIHIDTHHGGSAPYTLTYQTNMNPAGDAALVRFANERILARVREALRAEEYDGFWYTGPGQVDGVDGWVPTSVEPRKQHVYSTLSNMVGLLYESPSSSHRVVDDGTRVVEIPPEERYRHQVRGQYLGIREAIRFASEHGEELKTLIARAEARAIQVGHDDSDDDQIPIDYRQVNKGNEDFWVRRRVGRDPGARSGPAEYELVNRPVFTRFEATRTTTRPWGYLIPASQAKVIPLLLEHEITVKQLTAPAIVDAEVYYATEVRNTQYLQAHYLKAVDVEKYQETVELPAGTFFVPSGQPKGNLLSYLLEPETNDNIITWGFLDNVLEVTPDFRERESQRQAQRDRLSGLSPQQRSRLERRIELAERGQRIPIFRLMKKSSLRGVLIDSFNRYERNRYTGN